MSAPDATADADLSELSPWITRRLWSLRDMINCQIFGLCRYLELLRHHEGWMDAARFSEKNDVTAETLGLPVWAPPIVEQTRKQLENLIEVGRNICGLFAFETALNRLNRFAKRLRDGIDREGISAELRALREAIDDDMNFRYFYRYPTDKVQALLKKDFDWQKTIAAFPSVKAEIDDAVDCYAQEHYTASVFHLMRIAEHGLRAFAQEREIILPKGKPIEWGTWQEIISQIDTSINGQGGIAKTKQAGPVKDEALAFYNGALAHFYAFKDQYRNAVMHVRERYEEWQAQIALNHVRDFMNGLSAQLDENTAGPITWAF